VTRLLVGVALLAGVLAGACGSSDEPACGTFGS
jgi:hypothetical protein